MEKWFYARVSSKDQNVDRQIISAREVGIDERHIFIDKVSGKDENRIEWQRLQIAMRGGDLLYVSSLDRLSRNYKDLTSIIKRLRDESIDLIVLDNSLLDTSKNGDLLGTLIFDLTISILSYVAEIERTRIRERQKDGIAIALNKKNNGDGKYGRPKLPMPEDFIKMQRLILKKELTHDEYRKSLGMSQSTYFNRVRQMKKKI